MTEVDEVAERCSNILRSRKSAVLLIYFALFLDNVLLTMVGKLKLLPFNLMVAHFKRYLFLILNLVPIIPDYVNQLENQKLIDRQIIRLSEVDDGK